MYNPKLEKQKNRKLFLTIFLFFKLKKFVAVAADLNYFSMILPLVHGI